ncbi:hypothetical protein [Microbulbifer taiwanensis]|uniref:DUF3829 domain-containing protein n=1 Tax=Microbulbifer taiwanensis TaxID=986746 RepID=A0ABW1YK96_9GAMM|nr:hypothetical protein [Microbulbifer taiwanensis]
MKKLLLLSLLLFCNSAVALFTPSREEAQKQLDSLYEEYFLKLTFGTEPVFSDADPEIKRESLFVGLHEKQQRVGVIDGHWSDGVSAFPLTCKIILETGRELPVDYESKIYPKRRSSYIRKTFYEVIDECARDLSDNHSLFKNYNLALDKIVFEAMEREERITQKNSKPVKLEKESPLPDSEVYLETVGSLRKLSASNALLNICKTEYPYSADLTRGCLNSQQRALASVMSSLENLWASEKGRENIGEILKMLDSDLKDSMGVVDGKAVPDFLILKIRFRESLEKYCEMKGFSVYEAVAVLY